MPVFCGHPESAAMGCDVVWGEKSTWPDTRDHPYQDPDDIRMPSDFLERPSMRAVLDAIAILRQEYGERVAVIGKVYGPWNLAYHLWGTEELLANTILDPDKVRRYLDATMQVSLVSAQAQFRAGADAILWGDNITGDLVRAETHRDLLLPLHREITRAVGGPLILHICGKAADRLEYAVQGGFDCMQFDSKVDARQAKEIVGDRMALMGNVNCPATLWKGTPEDAYRETVYAMEAGVEIPAPECVVPLTTPLANLKAIVSAAIEYRSLPAKQALGSKH
jgi:[methyl-Co(III) methanol-specific corrinoid protein]:coenzyme M methyltransferase